MRAPERIRCFAALDCCLQQLWCTKKNRTYPEERARGHLSGCSAPDLHRIRSAHYWTRSVRTGYVLFAPDTLRSKQYAVPPRIRSGLCFVFVIMVFAQKLYVLQLIIKFKKRSHTATDMFNALDTLRSLLDTLTHTTGYAQVFTGYAQIRYRICSRSAPDKLRSLPDTLERMRCCTGYAHPIFLYFRASRQHRTHT